LAVSLAHVRVVEVCVVRAKQLAECRTFE